MIPACWCADCPRGARCGACVDAILQAKNDLVRANYRLLETVAREREACAATADDLAPSEATDSRYHGAQEACKRIAAAIRARHGSER